ncbi:hypothetical protein [Sphingobacterium paludis]|uniref:Uncharacterized protein n=1 Tax=Sphingobacterium paludis TaxID=1476465 RepID=A0A4R7CTK9_9SPHI|nr:hypothetical protein [Sphingobacterium paludis]TDS11749.1 hypothetical protein B0I21_10792 [Sphingobacterium paludis]
MPEESKQEKELKMLGFTGKLRTGLVTGIMAIMLGGIIWLARMVFQIQDDRLKDKDVLYDRIIGKVRLQNKAEITNQIQPIAEKVDTIKQKADSTFKNINDKLP